MALQDKPTTLASSAQFHFYDVIANVMKIVYKHNHYPTEGFKLSACITVRELSGGSSKCDILSITILFEWSGSC
jgi:hypothetical protein